MTDSPTGPNDNRRMASDESPAALQAALPETIVAKLRPKTERPAAVLETAADPQQQAPVEPPAPAVSVAVVESSTTLASRLKATVAAARAQGPNAARDAGARMRQAISKQMPLALKTSLPNMLTARPAWLSLSKLPVPQHVLEQGRRAGVGIGAALDRIKRELPKRAESVTKPADQDITTVAVRDAVRRPSIFGPGHVLTALIAGGVIHIATTFAITAFGTGSAFRQLRTVLPANAMVVLPPLAPGAQVLPYLAPDMLYALCRFELSTGSVEISALLPEAGWSLALYTRQGDNFYATPGQNLKQTPVSFVLSSASDRLVNITPGVRKNDVEVGHVTSPDSEGLLVVRAPLKGVAFEAATQESLKQAKCAPAKHG